MVNRRTKSIFRFFFGLTFFFTLISCVAAQGVRITKEEFYAAHRKSSEQLKDKPRRLVAKSVTRLERSIASYESVSEIAPPDKKRFYWNQQAEPKNSSPEFITETIEIGQKRYTRRNSGAWAETIITSKSENKIQNLKPQTESFFDYYFLGEITLNGRAADLYEVIVRDSLKTKQLSGEEKETSVSTKSKYWFGKNGLWTREESEYEFSDATTNKVTHRQQMTRTAEYDSNIKIEAPKIN